MSRLRYALNTTSTCPMESFHSASISHMFRIPLEIREEILSHLILPQHVQPSSTAPVTYTVRKHSRVAPTYVDSRIYLPSRMPTNILRVCKQLRQEGLAYHARRLNSSRNTTATNSRPAGKTAAHGLGGGSPKDSDEQFEQLYDDDTVRLTLEILRQSYGATGYYTPERREPSPRFMSLKPLLSRLKKLKFTVWAGYDWWSGESTRSVVKVRRLQRARLSRVSADQDDEVSRPARWEERNTGISLKPPQNPLSVAIDSLLQHLPLVEKVKIDLLIHDVDYWNWDLPETCWEGIRDWLDGPISTLAKNQVKQVDRRLIVVHHGHVRDAGTLLHQHESVQRDDTVIRVERRTRKVSAYSAIDQPSYA